MQTQVIDVTPEMAKEWIGKNSANRNLSIKLVGTYARDMMSGKWSLTHQGIAFYSDGTLCDGQHRLKAIIESGCTIPFLVTFGIDRNNGSDVDMHRARKVADAIKIGCLSDWIKKEAISIVNFMFFPGARASTHEIVEKCEQYKEAIQFAISNFTSTVRYVTAAHIYAAVVKAYLHGADRGRLADFCRVMITGIPCSTDDIAALRLREHLLQNGSKYHGTYQSRHEVHLKAQRAIKAFVNKEKISKVTLPSEEIYPIK